MLSFSIMGNVGSSIWPLFFQPYLWQVPQLYFSEILNHWSGHLILYIAYPVYHEPLQRSLYSHLTELHQMFFLFSELLHRLVLLKEMIWQPPHLAVRWLEREKEKDKVIILDNWLSAKYHSPAHARFCVYPAIHHGLWKQFHSEGLDFAAAP